MHPPVGIDFYFLDHEISGFPHHLSEKSNCHPPTLGLPCPLPCLIFHVALPPSDLLCRLCTVSHQKGRSMKGDRHLHTGPAAHISTHIHTHMLVETCMYRFVCLHIGLPANTNAHSSGQAHNLPSAANTYHSPE